jgi:hypothetical protein
VKRPGRVKRLIERIVLGTLMTIGVAVIERRLRKAARKRRA